MEYQRILRLSILPATGLIFTPYNGNLYIEAYDEHATVKIIVNKTLFSTLVRGLKDHHDREYILNKENDETLGSAIVSFPRIWWINKKYRISVKHLFTKEEWADFLSNLILLERIVCSPS